MLKSITNGFQNLIKSINVMFKNIKDGFINYFNYDIYTKLSFFVFGISHLKRKQYTKGILLLLIQMIFISFFILYGFNAIKGLITLGDVASYQYQDDFGFWHHVKGDNSMLMLLFGVVSLLLLLIYLYYWKLAYQSAVYAEKLFKDGKTITFKSELAALFDKNIHQALLTIPLLGIFSFTIIPLVYMILIAFTNYNYQHPAPNVLFDWVGFDNFVNLFAGDGSTSTVFWSVLVWTIIWAFAATFTCYFGGMFLALLINRVTIRFKTLWRTIFIITIAIPGFISLLTISSMLSSHGIINEMLLNLGFIRERLPFLTDETWARMTVIVVNMWVGIPYSMLITSGVLLNIPPEQYESARLDGASSFQTFRHITYPYMIFISTPYLVANFISNINNFNAIFYLTGGGPRVVEGHGAGKTDLLVTWLYRLTVDAEAYQYDLAATIGIITFIISVFISLLTLKRSKAYQDEERFR